jgi:hypothetical protein
LRLAVCVAGMALVACGGQAPLQPPPRAPAPRSTSPTPSAIPARPQALVGAAPSSSVDLTSPGSLPEVSQGEIGAAGPLRLLDASPSGAWVAWCDEQQRAARFVLGSGSGEPIDDVLARDETGRYVVLQQAGKALLIDASSGSRVDLSELGADLRRLRADYAEHRSLSFDARGKYLAYVRAGAARPAIVVRDLATGQERSFASGPGELLSVRLSADARYVSYEALREDTNNNGKLDWPAPEEVTRGSVCDRPALPKLRSFAYQGRGDAIVRGVLSLETGSLRDVPELLAPLGSSLLLRAADGALLLERGGKRTQLSKASCSGRVLFADSERELVLAACTPPPPKKDKNHPPPPPTGKRQVWLFGAGYAKDLQSELYETSIDREPALGTRLVPLYPGSEAGLLDLERRELLPLPAGSRVLTTNAALAVIWQGSDLLRYDAQSKTLQPLAHGVAKNPDFLQSGATILLSPFVVVGANGPALVSPGPALALTFGGMLLVPSNQRIATARVAIQGPLHWVDARLAPPDGPPR